MVGVVAIVAMFLAFLLVRPEAPRQEVILTIDPPPVTSVPLNLSLPDRNPHRW